MKLWPEVSYIDIINYFVFSVAVDGEKLTDEITNARRHIIKCTAIKQTRFCTRNTPALFFFFFKHFLKQKSES